MEPLQVNDWFCLLWVIIVLMHLSVSTLGAQEPERKLPCFRFFWRVIF
jgi:hypothetical protein